MKNTCFIPIKTNNERLKNKNTLLLGNKPLCSYIFDTVCKVKNIDDIYVFCSDESIKEYLPPEIKFLKRSESLDSQETTANDLSISFRNIVDSDIYSMLFVTSPFLKVRSIEKCIDSVLKLRYDSSFTVKRHQTFSWFKNKPINYFLDKTPRTQDIEPVYTETTGLYVYSQDVIDTGNRIGSNPYLLEVNDLEALDIDYKEDLDFCNLILKENNGHF